MYYTNQKQLTDTETEEVIGIMLKPTQPYTFPLKLGNLVWMRLWLKNRTALCISPLRRVWSAILFFFYTKL